MWRGRGACCFGGRPRVARGRSGLRCRLDRRGWGWRRWWRGGCRLGLGGGRREMRCGVGGAWLWGGGLMLGVRDWGF